MSDGMPEDTEHQMAGNQNRSGFVLQDSSDLVNVCRRLGITGPLEPLMRELTSGRTPQIPVHSAQQSQHQSQSHSNHQHRKSTNSRSDKKSLSVSRSSAHQPRTPDQQHKHTNPIFADGATAEKGTYGQESWGRDSGARDLSPADHTCRHLHVGVTDIDNGGDASTTSMIHLANQLQVAALSALKTEVLDLSGRLKNAERERDSFHRKMVEAMEEKDRAYRRLESIGSAHEARTTEMHCIIVELNRKLKSRMENAIMEEHEPEGSVSELSFQEGSVYNSEMENIDQDSPTEPLDVKLVQPIPRCSDSPASLPPPGNIHIQVQAMNEEILHLRGQVALLQSQLASQRDQHPIEATAENHSKVDSDLQTPLAHDRSAYTSDDLSETAEIFEVPSSAVIAANTMTSNEDTDNLRCASAKTPRQNRGENAVQYSSVTLPTPTPHHDFKHDTIPVAKMAERVRLRRTIDPASPLDIGSTVCTTEMAEHLVADMLQSDNVTAPDVKHWRNCFEHAQLQIKILNLTLAESRSHTNRLYLLCGKYESNAMALHQALCCSDRAVEAYDVMLALLESRIDILEAASKDTDTDDSGNLSCNPSLEIRRAAEEVAQHLLARLDNNEKHNWLGNSLGPWNEPIVLKGADKEKQKPWTESDTHRLRSAVSKLKGQRASIQNTVVNLESPFSDSDAERSHLAAQITSSSDSRRQELEMTVLLQELTNIREELTDSKQRTEMAVRDRSATLQRVNVMQEALFHLQAQLADTEQMLAKSNNTKDRSSYSEAEHSASIERELVDALARESRLKARLQGLAGSVEAATKSSEEKYVQVQNTVSDLKQTNMSLVQSLDRCRRKYQTRLRRLEQQMTELTEHNKTPSAGPNSKIVPETTL